MTPAGMAKQVTFEPVVSENSNGMFPRHQVMPVFLYLTRGFLDEPGGTQPLRARVFRASLSFCAFNVETSLGLSQRPRFKAMGVPNVGKAHGQESIDHDYRLRDFAPWREIVYSSSAEMEREHD